MSEPTRSYLKVQYELRPAKQVERRMLIDSLQMLMEAGFQIRSYKYTGMGSVYFIDFMLFHRLLGIRDMLSVEYDRNIAKRVEFNRPFESVDTEIAPIGQVIPKLSKDLKHLVWLDYDGVLRSSHLQDIATATTYLSVGSILLITVDIEPPTDEDSPEQWRQHFVNEALDFFDPSLQVKDFAKSKLPKRNIELVAKAIHAGLAGRRDAEFIPMFNFVYKDGNQMLTMGGMVGTSVEKRRVRTSALADSPYFRGDFETEPCVITVPRLTRKERQYLDGFMPCKDLWTPDDFELSWEMVSAYRDIYRYCPNYAEMLL
jgi:Putative O-methyltransferase